MTLFFEITSPFNPPENSNPCGKLSNGNIMLSFLVKRVCGGGNFIKKKLQYSGTGPPSAMLRREIPIWPPSKTLQQVIQ